MNDCGGKVHGNGWCLKHYKRVRKHGSPHIGAKKEQIFVCSVPDCGGKHLALGYCTLHYSRNKRHGNPLEKGYDRGGEVGYAAAHKRILKARGQAKEYKCEFCGGRAEEWALNTKVENRTNFRTGLWGNGSGVLTPTQYSLSPNDYIPLCRSCHTRFDRK